MSLEAEEIRQSYYKLYSDYFQLNRVLQNEIELRQKSLETLSDQISTQNQSDTSLNSNLSAMVDSNLNRAHRLMEKLNKKSKELLETKSKLRESQMIIEEKDEEIESLKSQINSTYLIQKTQEELDIEKLKSELLKKESLIEELKQDVQHKDAIIEQINEELKSKTVVLESLESDMNHKEESLKALVKEVKDTHKEMCEHQKVVNDFITTINESPWGCVKPYEEKIEKLEQELEMAKNQLENTRKETNKESQIIPTYQPNYDAQRLALINAQLIATKAEIERMNDQRFSNIQNTFDTILDEIHMVNERKENPEVQQTKKNYFSPYKLFKISLYILIISVLAYKL